MYRRLMIGTLLLLIAGCASIPMHTAWRLSRLSVDDMLRLDPAQLRVKVAVPSGFAIDVGTTKLKLTVSASGQKRIANMELAELDAYADTRRRGLFHHDAAVNTVVLALDADSRKTLRAMQTFVREHGMHHYAFSLVWPLAKKPPDAKRMTVWADLQLRTDRGYMPLVDAVTLSLPDAQSDPAQAATP